MSNDAKRVPRHHAMVDFLQHQERIWVVPEEHYLKVEKERDQLRAELAKVQAQRDAILLQAQCWAGEAKAQRHTVQEVGSILGGIPDWGPISAGVEELRKDAERLDFVDALRERPAKSDMHFWQGGSSLYVRTGVGARTAFEGHGADVRSAIDAAMSKEVTS